jgi:hypothetical protein
MLFSMAAVSALLLAVVSSGAAPGGVPGQVSPAGSYVDCQDACRDCQKACQQNVPAGSKQSDCIRACTGAAAGCCSAFGKSPPSGLTCTCS